MPVLQEVPTPSEGASTEKHGFLRPGECPLNRPKAGCPRAAPTAQAERALHGGLRALTQREVTARGPPPTGKGTQRRVRPNRTFHSDRNVLYLCH